MPVKIKISMHAIDSASLRFEKLWHDTKKTDEGLYTWLMRMCHEAILISKINEDGWVYYGPIKFVFETGKQYILKTVVPYHKTKESIDEIKKKIIIKDGRHEFIKPYKYIKNELSI